MMNKSKLLAAFLLSVSSCVVGFAQQTTVQPATPTIPGVQSFSFDFDGNSSYLGVQTQNVTRENFSKFGLRDVRGVAVEKVLENSPAAAAGLQNGDVIVRFNGEEISSVRKLTRMISEVAPDHQAKITILRGGNEREITATLGKRPAMQFEDGAFSRVFSAPRAMNQIPLGELPRVITPGRQIPIPPMGDGETFTFYSNSRQIGVSTSSLGKQLGDYFGVADGKGVLVSSVVENSPAAKAGLKAGDVIVEADGKAVDQPGALSRALNEKKEGDVTLTVIRNRNRQTIKVTPEKRSNTQFQQLFEREEGAILAPTRIPAVPRTNFRRVVPSGAPIRTVKPRPSTRVI